MSFFTTAPQEIIDLIYTFDEWGAIRVVLESNVRYELKCCPVLLNAWSRKTLCAYVWIGSLYPKFLVRTVGMVEERQDQMEQVIKDYIFELMLGCNVL